MSVRVTGAIGFGNQSSAMFIDMAAYSAATAKPVPQTVPDEKIISHLPWSYWGSNNLLPNQYINDIEKCGVLNSIIDGKARFALCQGLIPAIVHTDTFGQRVIERIVDDPEIVDFLEMNNHFDHVYGWMLDQIGFGWVAGRYMLNKKMDKIVSFQRDDVSEIRFSKKDPRTGVSSHLYYSANWDKISSPNDNRVFKVPLLSYNNAVADLTEKAEAGIAQHAIALRNPGWNKHYYPVPIWMANYLWVKIAQGVPEMKQALFENSMRPKYMVIIHEEYWENRYGTDWMEWDEDKQYEKRQELYDEIDNWLVGSKNAHKSIFVNGYRDEKGTYTDIEIKPIEDNTKPGELLPDSAAANSEIAIGMLWNPAMTGGNQKAGLYQGNEGGSNVREATLFQTILHEVERQKIRRIMNVIKYFNGWTKGKYKGLEFIIPATVLTTTDTGGSSKPVVTGNVNPKKDGADKNDAGSQGDTAQAA